MPSLQWNSTGITIIGTTSQSGNTTNKLYLPWDLAIDWTNEIYITDQKNNRVQKFPMGVSTGSTVAGYENVTSSSSLYGLSGPLGMVIDESHNVYVSDTNNNRVVLWPNGALSGSIFAGNGK